MTKRNAALILRDALNKDTSITVENFSEAFGMFTNQEADVFLLNMAEFADCIQKYIDSTED